jgi:hypothetical protein
MVSLILNNNTRGFHEFVYGHSCIDLEKVQSPCE